MVIFDAPGRFLEPKSAKTVISRRIGLFFYRLRETRGGEKKRSHRPGFFLNFDVF